MMSSATSYLRKWWRPRSQELYLPLPNNASDEEPLLPTTSLPTHSEPLPPAFSSVRGGPDRKKSRFYKTMLPLSLVLNAIMVYFTFAALNSPPANLKPRTPLVVCPAPLPNIFSVYPPSTTQHPQIHDAVQSFEEELASYFDSQKTDDQIDSVAVAVVTRDGPLIEAFHGLLRANESSSSTLVDRDSIFRIASVSKLFTALETFILREKGALNLDDRVSRFLNTEEHSRLSNVTIRQLLSHMSGMGRDWPPGDATHSWPHSLKGKGSPPYSGMPMPNRQILLNALDNNTWISEPYTYPVYSNTAYAILGLVNRLADKLHNGRNQELTHAQLLERDIFLPLKFNGSTFKITDEYKSRAAVSSSESWETDWDFGEVSPMIGQLSSLSDFIRLAQTFLESAVEPDSLLPPVVMREWLRPLHNEWDGFTSVGMPWEITRHRYSLDKSSPKNRTIAVYQKLGDISSHQAGVTILPSRSVVIVVLTTGQTSIAEDVTKMAIDQLMPALDSVLTEEVDKQLGGRWVNDDESIAIELKVFNGSLYAVEYQINGVDALQTLQGQPTDKMALWSSGNDYYRLSPSRSSADGCMPHWIGLDAFPYSNGAPVNLLHLREHSQINSDNVLSIPSMKLDLKRKKN